MIRPYFAAPALAALALAVLAACASPASRIKKRQELFDAYPAATQERIKKGEVDVGFTADMVRMALGEPSRKSTRTTAEDVEETWIYEDGRSGVGLSLGAGTFGGSYGGGVSVGGGAPPPRERAIVIFARGLVVSIEKPK